MWYNICIGSMSNIRQVILSALSRQGPLSVDELARAAHLSKMAARYHVALLVRQHLVAAQAKLHRGGVGRPQVIYALTEGASERLPKQYDHLATALLEELVSSYGPHQVRALLRRMGRRQAATAPVLHREADLASGIRRAAQWLAARGYMASARTGGEHMALVVGNCPFRRVARTHPEVCEMDMAMIAALLGVSPKRIEKRAAERGHCRFEISRAMGT